MGCAKTPETAPMPRKAAQPSLSEQQAAPGGVGAVDRAISLLDVFTPDRPLLSLAELAEASQQYKSTVLRLLASLAHSHVVKRHADGRFSLGSTIPRLHAVYAASFSIESVLVPALRELVEATRESAAYHIRQGTKRLCLYGVDSPQTIRDHTQVGALMPLGKGAVGSIFTLFGSPPRGARDARDPIAIAPTDMVREVAAIAAPVFDAGSGLAGVIALTMPAMRLQP
ncbi:MAG: helix-turn-helix domain-containing protein, partial [Solirubrobacteraceae bacterium]|nr:helix-turn-helix domain-containing protein [Solirubrobacteraceae bacterium]